MNFGQYIRKLREARGLTLSNAARELGMMPQKLSDIEQGRRMAARIPLDLLRRISQVYDHPLTNLISNTEAYQYERQIARELFDELEGLLARLEAKALAMVLEARQYTPEMESMANEALSMVGEAKTAVLVAKTKVLKRPAAKRTVRLDSGEAG